MSTETLPGERVVAAPVIFDNLAWAAENTNRDWASGHLLLAGYARDRMCWDALRNATFELMREAIQRVWWERHGRIVHWVDSVRDIPDEQTSEMYYAVHDAAAELVDMDAILDRCGLLTDYARWHRAEPDYEH